MSENDSTSPQQWKPIPALTEEEKQRFYTKIDRSSLDGCHPWTGMLSDSGYPIFCIKRRRYRATRVGWFLAHGIDPGPKLILHSCDYPPCMREDHLHDGTNKQNMREAFERGRFATGARNGRNTHPERHAIGEAVKGAKLTESKVLEIRERYAKGETGIDLAKEFGVQGLVVHRILKGLAWKHVGGPIVHGNLPKGPRKRTRWGPRIAT